MPILVKLKFDLAQIVAVRKIRLITMLDDIC
jgi:hypothetical protein